jgi:branched-chain amino acid transport system permease protein
MEFSLFLQQLVNALVLGSTYALVALGLTMIVGVLDILSFAHVEITMLGAYAALISIIGLRLPFGLVLGVSTLVGGMLSVPLYVISFRFVDKSVWTAASISTMGFGIVLTTAASRIWGTDQMHIPDQMSAVTFSAGRITVSLSHLVIILTASLIMIAMHLFLKRTRTGKAIRAVAESYSTASLLGIHVEKIIAITVIISGFLAGATGVLTSFAYHTITPFIGFNLLIKGLTGMVLGGMGNVYGAMIGGVIVGFLETMAVNYWSAIYQDALVFAALMAVLMFRPAGLLGVRIQERG